MKSVTAKGTTWGIVVRELDWRAMEMNSKADRKQFGEIQDEIEAQLPTNHDDPDDPDAYWNNETEYAIQIDETHLLDIQGILDEARKETE